MQADPEVLAWSQTDRLELAAGRIATDEFSHQRTVLFVKPEYWVVMDRVTGDGSHDLTRQFHFPKVDTETGDGWAQTAFDDGANVRVAAADDAAIEIRDGFVPDGSATVAKAPVATFINNEASLPATLCTVISPFENPESLPEVEPVAGEGAAVSRVRLTFPDGEVDDIAIAPQPGKLTIGDHSADARALCVRNGPRADGISIIEGDEVRRE